MPQCYLCHKGNMRNLQVSHAKNRSKKIRKPNLHSYTLIVKGMNKKVKLCTKCLRREKKNKSKITLSKKGEEK